MMNAKMPAFDLWDEPWIQVQRLDGSHASVGLHEALCQANQLAAIAQRSPLATVGIHRLLVAILQEALAPQSPIDLRQIMAASAFDPAAVDAFGLAHRDRLDLFSQEKPFMQSADLEREPERLSGAKTVGYLALEEPTVSEVNHFRHVYDDDVIYCASCAAAGLVSLSAFATSGGRGLRPSINGVPPVYVLPMGRTLFHTLALSLTYPGYQPPQRDQANDRVWWRREPLVAASDEISAVGYLHSLTFPARRIRLHPVPMASPCARCGRQTPWGVRTMIFQMGEYRPKEADWTDPFVAYRITKRGPVPVRPQEGKALWREYGALFVEHAQTAQSEGDTQRPLILNEIADLYGQDGLLEGCRCVGIRTDGKAKILSGWTSRCPCPSGCWAISTPAQPSRWAWSWPNVARDIYIACGAACSSVAAMSVISR